MSLANPTEAEILAAIRRAVPPHVRLFRNSQGLAWVGEVVEQQGDVVVLRNARRTRFVLAEGASDLIGLTQVVVTPKMLGTTIAQFTAAEVKRVTARRAEAHQQQFLDFVRGFGGLADVVRSEQDLWRLTGR